MATHVRNQAYLRRRNKEDIINLLREQSRSYSDIARVLKLSNTAIAKIADDLIADDIIYRDGDTKGRAGINLSINGDFGYVIAVDFSHWNVQYCAADFNGKILVQHNLGKVEFLPGDMEKLIKGIYDIMDEDVLKDKKLRCISIATPGKIDKKSKKFICNPRFKSLQQISLYDEFSKEFGCLVIVKNDIQLALSGEKMYGSALKDINNALMLHIDIGTGSSLLINGKVYEGSNGFAGEIGFFKLNMLLEDKSHYANQSFSNYYDSLSLFSVLSIVQREIFAEKKSIILDMLKKDGKKWNDVNLEMLIEAYKQNDELICSIVNAEAHVIGSFISCITEFLDMDMVLLNGSVTNLGDQYIQEVKKYAGGHSICYSTLGEQATIMGAIDAGINSTYQGKL